MTVPALLVEILALIGLFTITWFTVHGTKSLVYYSKFKTFPKTVEQEKFILLQKENSRLTDRLSQVQSENDEMTRAVLQRLS